MPPKAFPHLTPEQQSALYQQRLDEDRTLIHALQQAGVYIDSIYDLVKQKGNYARAMPLLVKLLPTVSDAMVKQGIVRALGQKDAIGLAEEALIHEFLAVPPDLLGGESLKWAIGNTLEIIASDKYAEQLISLASDKQHGTSRQMLVVGLGKLKKSPQVVDALILLLDDEDVSGHAVIALGKLKALKAAPKLKQLQNDSKRWIRTEVNKALRRMKIE